MKRALLLLGMLAFIRCSIGQGLIEFINYDAAHGVNGQVTRADGSLAGLSRMTVGPVKIAVEERMPIQSEGG